MQNDQEYFSMMGLLKEESLRDLYCEGTWHKFEDLGEVIEKMDKHETGKEDKHSIPDVYGRPLQLRITLESAMKKSEIINRYNLTNEIIVWRGIFTAIALQDFLDLKMKVDVIKYTGEENAFDKALRYPPRSNVFSAVRNWDERIFHIVTLKGDNDQAYSDIAMFSPLTVIYPIAGLEMPKVKRLKWYDYENNSFINPTEVLNPTEKLIVCFWLQHLRELLMRYGDGREADIIRYHLNDFDEELKKGLEGRQLAPKECFELVEYDEEFRNTNNELINEILNKTVKVKVWIDGEHQIEYKDLFAEQLYCTKNSYNPYKRCSYSSSHKVIDAIDWYALVPLGKKIQEQCGRKALDALMRNFQMKAISDLPGEIKYVKAELRLSEIMDKNVDVEKVYEVNTDGDIVRGNSPVIAMWPQINTKDWKRYYIYVDGVKDGIKLNLKDSQTGSNKFVEALEAYPGAISLKRTRAQKEFDIGMIFPEYREYETEQQETAKVSAVVGIDFGTSGTTACVHIGNESRNRMMSTRKTAAKLLTDATDSDRGYMSRYFVKPEEDEGKRSEKGQNRRKRSEQEKLYSIYLRCQDKLLNHIEPILDGIIYQANINENTEDLDRFMPDIKWENSNNGAYYKAFIEEFCLYVWEELRQYHISSIEWRYALPINLERKDIFHSAWRDEILAFLKSSIAIGHSVATREYSESEAASRYFLASDEIRMVNSRKGYMIVDIGGGSTDIAVWQKRNSGIAMVAQTSVPVAGRMMFTRWLKLNLNKIKEHAFPNGSVVVEQLLELVNKESDYIIADATLERIVNQHNDSIMNSYLQNTEWADRLKKQLEFGVALLFFALGSMAGYLQEKGLLEKYNEGNFGIALGGNGSKILDWMKMRENYPELISMFQEGICSRRKTDYAWKPQIIRSRSPKEEVAQGLVQEGWDNVPPSEEDICELITNELAISWNRIFLDKYNELFYQEISVNEDDIRNLLANVDRKMDVCNFFMACMYKKYYLKILGDLK